MSELRFNRNRRRAVELRVRVFEDLGSTIMVTRYAAGRPGEVGHVAFLGRPADSRPGGSVMR